MVISCYYERENLRGNKMKEKSESVLVLSD